jgi:hypothetical protein
MTVDPAWQQGVLVAKALRLIVNFIVGGVFAGLTVIVLSPLFAAFMPGDSSDTGGASSALAFIPGGLVWLLVLLAPSVRRGFGRSFLSLGSATVLLPISMLALSGRVTNDMVLQAGTEADQGAAAVGGMLAGGLATGLAGFVGFIVGGILLILGLVLSLGGTREVVIKSN